MQIIPAILTERSDEALHQMMRLSGITSWIQIDVMDSTMTKDSTFDLSELAGKTEIFNVEVHLMVDDPIAYFPACAAIGAQRVYIHPEPLESVHEVFSAMSEYDFDRGLSISPQTSVAQIVPYIDEIDAVQVMTVEPGKQGQKFMSEMLKKVYELKTQFPSLWVSVDGGVDVQTIHTIRAAGADAAGVGSAISNADDVQIAYKILSKE